MCDGPDVDRSYQNQMIAEAAAARAEEEARQARIKDGTTKVNQNFAQFDDGYWNGRQQSYLDFYYPELDDQFGDAKDDLTFAHARAGTLNSSMAGANQGKLLKKFDTQKAITLSQAKDDTAAAQGRVSNEKSSLIAQLNATGDSAQVSNDALARSKQLYAEKPYYAPLGQIFGGVTEGIGNYFNGAQSASARNAYFSRSPRSSATVTVK